MTDDEVNRIIAKFMGLHVHDEHIVTSVHLGRVNGLFVGRLYTASLDAQLPVWGKLHDLVDYTVINEITNAIARDLIDRGLDTRRAAATATAIAIQEIGET